MENLKIKSKKEKILKGFTLIEVLIAIFVFTLAIGALFNFIIMGYKTNAYNWQESMAVNEARQGIETMVKEIREAKTGEDGSYPIEKADDKQFIFYSDIDNDGKVEKVRYFLSLTNSINSGSSTLECTAANTGGACNLNFPNFITGLLQSASATVSAEGDLDKGSSDRENVSILIGTNNIGTICNIASPSPGTCGHCMGIYQDTTTFDVTNLIGTSTSVTFTAQGNTKVDKQCPSSGPYDHSMKTRLTLNWTEQRSATGTDFEKGVIEPVGNPAQYPSNQEKISIISSYVRNAPPIFEYYDTNGNKITNIPARVADTKLMKVDLVVNINPNRPPNEYELKSSVELRNLNQ